MPHEGRPVLFCAVLSVSLHAALLAYQAVSSHPLSSKPVPSGGSSSKALPNTAQVRVVLRTATVQPAGAPHAAGTSRPPRPREPEQGLSTSTAAAVSATWGGQVAAPAANRSASEGGLSHAPLMEQIALASAPEAQPPEVARPLTALPDDFDGTDYLPRSQLSTPPSARTPITLNAPMGNFASERHVGILSVFIDEKGRVQHVAAEGSTLPPAFEQIARDAFSATLFLPGQLNGYAVKSRQRVEVVFDSTPVGGDIK
jgi:periplasmic protein TonB